MAIKRVVIRRVLEWTLVQASARCLAIITHSLLPFNKVGLVQGQGLICAPKGEAAVGTLHSGTIRYLPQASLDAGRRSVG